jgi:putative redox protein
MANIVNVNWNNQHEGLVKVENFETKLSYKGEGLAPYEMFLGGFASCLHATFVGIAKKKRVEFDNITYNVYGEKRDTVPTLLKYVKTTITVQGVEEKKQKAFIKSMELAEKYCSISVTISKIADMEFEYIFK